MITPAYAPTATERVLPRMALDFTTASLDPRVTVTRALNTATRVNASGLIEIVNADLPRFDFDPVTLRCKGLLIEESRANLLPYSVDFGNAAWYAIGAKNVSTDAAVAPDGTTTADAVSDNSAVAFQGIATAISVANDSVARTFSIFVKKTTGGTAPTFGMNLAYSGGTGVTAAARLNTDTGAFTIVGGSATVTDFNTYWRLTVTATNNSTGNTAIIANLYPAVGTTAGGDSAAATGTAIIWGAQLEAGAFATSYIPTTTTSVTRNADVVTMTGTNFSSWYNASAGTLMVSATGYNAATVAQGGTAPTAVSLYAAAAVNPYATIAIARRDNATLNSPSGFILSDTGSLGADIQKNTVSWVGATVNAAIAWNGSTDAAFTANGLTVGTDTSYTLPTSDSLQIGRWGSETISGYWSGHIRRVSFYPQRLTNAELQAITN